jgi:hypothetical protein
MKKLIVLFTIFGFLVGLFAGGLFYSVEYAKLYQKYYNRGKALQMLSVALKQCTK